VSFNPILIEANNPSPMTGRGNNTYLIAEPGGAATLIDAGVGDPSHLDSIDRHLNEQQARLRDVLVTHAHADHASGVPALGTRYPSARFHKAPWPEEDARYHVTWEPLVPDQRLKAGAEPLVVVATPGHSPDHVAFWHEPSRTVFTGDLVTLGSSVMIEASKGGDLRQYLDALDRILRLTPRRLLPAHGPGIENPAIVLNQYLDHRRMREKQVVAALASGKHTVQAIAERIYDGLDPALMPAARENVRAHLLKLKADGAVFEINGQWTD
jgi:glyoxylase-like metal-dependent hydrolase (beta-lactamase superfamily II)